MTELPPQLLEAKKWCDDARELLKQQKLKTRQGRGDIESRVKAIVEELTKLNGALKTQHPEVAQQFLARFASIAKNLKDAVAKKDAGLVDAEALALAELKKEIRVAMLQASGKSPKDIQGAQKKVDSIRDKSGEALKQSGQHNYDEVYGPLVARIGTALGWTGVSARVGAAQTALRLADKQVTDEAAAGRLGAALGLIASTGLAGLLDAAEKAKTTFDQCKQQFTTIDQQVQPVLGWDPNALEAPIAKLLQEIQLAHGNATTKATSAEYEDAAQILVTAGLPQKAQDAIAAKPLSEHYAKERADAEKDREALRKHAQKAHIDDEWTQSRQHLDRAAQRATAVRYAEARSEIADVARLVGEGKTAADEFAKFLGTYANARVIVVAMEDAFGQKSYWEGQRDRLENARTDADTNRNYVGAAQEARGVVSTLKSSLVNWYVSGMQSKVQEIKTLAGTRTEVVAFVQPDLDEIERMRKQIDADIKGERWTAALWEGQKRANDVALRTKKYVQRRIEYHDARKPVAVKVEQLRTEPKLAGRLTSINLELRQADFYASRDAMRIERGLAVLARLDQECDALTKIAKLATDYATQRKAADDELERLGKDPAAAALKAALEAVRGVLAQATEAAADDGQVDPDWAAGLAFVATAMKDLAAADALAKSLAAAVAAQQAAGDAKDLPQVGTTLTTLQQRAEAAGKRAHADVVADDRKRATTALTTAAAMVKANDLKAAQTALVQAAAELLALETVQLRHAECTTRSAAIEKQQQDVPDQDKVAPKIEATAKELKQAADLMKTRDYDGARASLHRAETEVAAAEQAAKDRKAFDERAKEVGALHTAMAAGAAKEAVGKVLAEATRHATALAFAPANRALVRAESQIDVAAMASLASTTPNDAAILERAQKIIDRGDAKLLDKFLADLPATADLGLVKKLAQKRFGITLEIELGTGPNAAQEALATTKKMWQMFAKVPEDSRGNPSLKVLKRLKPGEAGGFYRSSEDLVVMHGRPQLVDQTFGSKLKNAAGKDQLPADIDDIYQPINEDPIDYFDFATLHEVGHAVDDRLGFMAKREGDGNFGGWRSHGGDLKYIAGKVAKACDDFDATYVEDVMLKRNPAAPNAPKGKSKSAWAKSKKKVDDWYAAATTYGVWWDNAASMAMAIGGEIFQEAYGNTWVSYSANARSRGITGYQFRAPGEWFAELYASHHAGKLKKSHPASRWLSELTR